MNALGRLLGAATAVVLLATIAGCGSNDSSNTSTAKPKPAAVKPSPTPTEGTEIAGKRLPPTDKPHETNGTTGVTLTFDDGPDPIWTPKVLAVLRKYQAHAVFCMVGFRVQEHPELVRRIAAEGHTLCNHTMKHERGLGHRPDAAIRQDLDSNNKLITKASGGIRPYYFRAPEGDFTPRQVKVAAGLGLASLGWRVTSSDWQHPLMEPKPMASWIGRTMKPGCIILFHDAGSPGTHWHTVGGLKLVLADIRKRGWKTTSL